MAEAVQIDIRDVLKQAMHQFKLEEISAWMRAHGTTLFFLHEKGFTMINKSFLEKHPKLKKELDSILKEVEMKEKEQPKSQEPEEKHIEESYFG